MKTGGLRRTPALLPGALALALCLASVRLAGQAELFGV